MGTVSGDSNIEVMAARTTRVWAQHRRGRGRQRPPRNLPMVDGVGGQRRDPGQRAGGWLRALGGRGKGVRWAGSVPGLGIG